MDTQRWLHLSCLAALVLTLAACGGSNSSDAAGVRKDVAKALTTADRSICELRRYATPRYVRQDSFSIPELVKVNARTCRRDVKGFAAHAVKLSRVEVDGDRATARLEADGGALSYGVLDLALVRDGTWKLDRITAVDLDRRRFDALQRQFSRLDSDPPPNRRVAPSIVACFERRIDRRSDAEIERAIVRGDPTLVSDPLIVCVLRPQLRKSLPLELTSCVVEQVRRDDEALLRFLLSGDRDDDAASQKLFREAAEVCALARGRTS